MEVRGQGVVVKVCDDRRESQHTKMVESPWKRRKYAMVDCGQGYEGRRGRRIGPQVQLGYQTGCGRLVELVRGR